MSKVNVEESKKGNNTIRQSDCEGNGNTHNGLRKTKKERRNKQRRLVEEEKAIHRTPEDGVTSLATLVHPNHQDSKSPGHVSGQSTWGWWFAIRIGQDLVGVELTRPTEPHQTDARLSRPMLVGWASCMQSDSDRMWSGERRLQHGRGQLSASIAHVNEPRAIRAATLTAARPEDQTSQGPASLQDAALFPVCCRRKAVHGEETSRSQASPWEI